MKQVLDKQKMQGTGLLAGNASTSKLETLTREGNVVYLDFAKKQVDELQKLNKTMGEGLGDKGELAKTLKEIKSTFKAGAITEKVMGLQPKGNPGAIAPPTGFKDFFTLRGFLDKTKILKRGHTESGIGKYLDKKLETREQKGLQAEAEKKDYAERKQQYVSDRMATKGSTFGNEKSFAKAFDESEKLQKEIVKNEQSIKGLQERGFKEGQIKRGGFFEKKESLEKDLAKTDTRFSESFGGVDSKSADPNKPKTVKAADDTDRNSTKKKSADIKPIKVESVDSKIKPELNKPKTVAADVDDPNSTKKKSADIKPIMVESVDSKIKADPAKPKTVKAADVDDPNSTKKRAKTVKKAADSEEDLPSNVIKFPGKAKSSGMGSADLTEADIEQQKVEDAQTKLLQEIADNTVSLKKPVGNKPEPPSDGMGLGVIGAILAGIVGSIVGLARAWVKTIKLFAEALIPTELMEKVKKGFSAVEEFFSNIFSKFKALFDFSGESKIGKIFASIKEGLSAFIKPFVTAYEVISDLLKGPIKMVEGLFTTIKEYFTMFAKSVGKVAIIAEKIFFPILIVMTIWDTVKGAIEGFMKEGIIGGIKGAITGFFNSLIFGPIDMLKDAIAWVLGFFGFDKAKALLESFSLEDIFKKFIDAIFAPIDLIKKLFTGIMSWFENIEIPGFDTHIPGIGKVGPWKPFKKEEKTAEIKPGNSDAGAGRGSSAAAAKDPRRVDVDKEQVAYEKLGFFDRRKVDVGYAKATDLLSKMEAEEPKTGNKVAAASAESDLAKNAKPAAATSNVVAPTTITNSSSNTYAMKPPVRNPDAGMQGHLAKKYA